MVLDGLLMVVDVFWCFVDKETLRKLILKDQKQKKAPQAYTTGHLGL